MIFFGWDFTACNEFVLVRDSQLQHGMEHIFPGHLQLRHTMAHDFFSWGITATTLNGS